MRAVLRMSGRAAAESSKWADWIESYHGGPRTGRELRLTGGALGAQLPRIQLKNPLEKRSRWPEMLLLGVGLGGMMPHHENRDFPVAGKGLSQFSTFNNAIATRC